MSGEISNTNIHGRAMGHASMRVLGAALLAGAGLVALANPAAAQGAEDTSGPIVLGPVQVQAEQSYQSLEASSPKFTAPLLDTPKAITIIPETLIQDMGATSLGDALRTVPGITMGMGEGGNPFGDRPFIRGFDSQSDTFVDGVRDTGSQTREVFDIESVEVVKGPDSAFTGRGSAGGSINIVTKKPVAENFVKGSATLGNDNLLRFTADGNYVLSDGVAFRLNAMWHDGDIPGRNDVNNSRWGIAPSLAVGLGGPTRVLFGFYHMQTDDVPDYGIPYDTVTGRPVKTDLDNFYGLLDRDFRKTTADIGSVRVEHDFGHGLTLRNTAVYSTTTNDYITTNPDDSAGNVINGAVWRNTKSRNSTTHVFTDQIDLSGRFRTGFIHHRFATGFEYSDEESRNRNYVVDTGNRDCAIEGIGAPSYNCTSLANPNPHDPWNGAISRNPVYTIITATSKSLYAVDTAELTKQWSVNLGLRWDDFRLRSSDGSKNNSSFVNYQAGLVYKPVEDATLYFTYATSSNPAGSDLGEGANRIGVANANLDPERNVSYELGGKWNMLDGKLSATAALFRNEKTNARVAIAPGRGAPLDNLGTERVDGFEISLSGNITEKWALFGGYSYLDATILDSGPVNAYDGNRFPNTPKHSISLWTSYDVTPDFQLGGGANYMAKIYGDPANTKSIPSYWRFDAMASYRFSKHVSLQLNAQNIFNKRYFDRAYTTHMATVAPGRAILLTANVSY